MPRTLVQALAFVIGLWLAIELVQPIGLGWMGLPRLGPAEQDAPQELQDAPAGPRDPFARPRSFRPAPGRSDDGARDAASHPAAAPDRPIGHAPAASTARG